VHPLLYNTRDATRHRLGNIMSNERFQITVEKFDTDKGCQDCDFAESQICGLGMEVTDVTDCGTTSALRLITATEDIYPIIAVAAYEWIVVPENKGLPIHGSVKLYGEPDTNQLDEYYGKKDDYAVKFAKTREHITKYWVAFKGLRISDFYLTEEEAIDRIKQIKQDTGKKI